MSPRRCWPSPRPPPAAALGAGRSATAARIRRLIAAPAPLGQSRAAAGMLAVAALAAFPVLVLAGPAAAVSGQGYARTWPPRRMPRPVPVSVAPPPAADPPWMTGLAHPAGLRRAADRHQPPVRHIDLEFPTGFVVVTAESGRQRVQGRDGHDVMGSDSIVI